MNTTTPVRPPADVWPAFTTHAEDDVVIAAVSLVRLAALCGTPCVHTADSTTAGTHGSLEDELASVVVARVVTAGLHGDLLLHVTVDADLSGCRPALGDARLVGREAADEPTPAVIDVPGAAAGELHCELPADLRPGDLLVIPCSGTTPLRSITLGAHG